MFATLQTNAANTAEFQALQPQRLAEAQTQFKNVLELMSEKQRLETVFGPGHPKVKDIQDQIDLVKTFLAEKQGETELAEGSGMMDPEALYSVLMLGSLTMTVPHCENANVNCRSWPKMLRIKPRR